MKGEMVLERKCENKCTTFFNKKAKLLYYEPIIETYVCEKDVGTVGNKDNANNDGEIGGNEGNNTPATDFELSEDTSNEYGPIS